jgi:hypothetical protein
MNPPPWLFRQAIAGAAAVDDVDEEGEIFEARREPPTVLQDELLQTLNDHGLCIYDALRSRFKNETIVTMETHLESIEEPPVVSIPVGKGWLCSIWSLLRFPFRERNGKRMVEAFPTSGAEPARKRQRAN